MSVDDNHMNVYVLIFEVGLTSGYRQLIGVYESIEHVEEAMEKDMIKRGYGRSDYHIEEIELNKEVNITIAEW